jgi:cysteine protease ATG4
MHETRDSLSLQKRVSTADQASQASRDNTSGRRHHSAPGIGFGVQLATIFLSSLRSAKERIVHLINMTDQPKFDEKTCTVWMLGVKYDLSAKPAHIQYGGAHVTAQKIGPEGPSPSDESQAFKHDIQSRFWLTYRRNFIPIRNSSLTSDAGWGCMLRSGQMMVAQALAHHKLGRSWRLPCETASSSPTGALPAAYHEIVDLFRDHPSAPFSIHNIAAAGEEVGGRRVGQWLGPCTVCAAIAHLWRCLGAAPDSAGACLGLRALLLDSSEGDNTIYTGLARPLLADGPLLLLLPVRLGAHTLDASYIPQVPAHH